MKLLAWIIGFLSGAIFAWGVSHVVIATECKRLGGFYVGGEVFECRLKEIDHADHQR